MIHERRILPSDVTISGAVHYGFYLRCMREVSEAVAEEARLPGGSYFVVTQVGLNINGAAHVNDEIKIEQQVNSESQSTYTLNYSFKRGTEIVAYGHLNTALITPTIK